MTRKQAFQIPESITEELNLELDDAAASPQSEVVVWPWHPNTELRHGAKTPEHEN